MPAVHVCPIMTSGKSMDILCLQEKCAWYIPGLGACSMYLIAHDAALNIRAKQQQGVQKGS